MKILTIINSTEAGRERIGMAQLSSSRTCYVQRRHKKESGNNRDQHTDRQTDEITFFLSYKMRTVSFVREKRRKITQFHVM